MSKETKLEIKEEEIIKVEETNDVSSSEEVVDTVEVVKQPKMADTIALAVESGLVAIDPTLEEVGQPKEPTDEECERLISKDKVLEIVNTAFSKYQGKVVLAMEEVRTMVNEIVYAVNE